MAFIRKDTFALNKVFKSFDPTTSEICFSCQLHQLKIIKPNFETNRKNTKNYKISLIDSFRIRFKLH